MTRKPEDGAAGAGPLEGVRVIEFAQALSTPFAATILADMGAEVVKVEPPRGDSYRLQQRTHVRHEGRDFAVCNRGKRSLCLDLSLPESALVVERLVARADVALVAMKAPDIPRYGLDYERLLGARPDLVYLESTPYGTEGPLRSEGGYDVVAMGLSGLTAVVASADGDQPRFVRPAFADIVTGMMSALGVVAALRHRDRTGEGQRVQTSLFHTALGLISNYAYRYDELDGDRFREFERMLAQIREEGAGFLEQQHAYSEHFGGRPPGNIYFRHYRTADGFLSVGCLSPRLNARLREATGLVDPRGGDVYARGSDEERAALDALVEEAEALFVSRPTERWLDVLSAHGVPAARLNFPHEIFEDPQARANGYVAELDHRDLGPYTVVTTPLKMDATPIRPRGPSPRLGEHTDEVLAEIGFDLTDREALVEKEIVGPADAR